MIQRLKEIRILVVLLVYFRELYILVSDMSACLTREHYYVFLPYTIGIRKECEGRRVTYVLEQSRLFERSLHINVFYSVECQFDMRNLFT